MRVKFMKYGKRMIGSDGQSEYFEASVEVGPGENPDDCAREAKRFVRAQLAESAAEAPLKASLGSRLSSSNGHA